jgi:hypothetical protein
VALWVMRTSSSYLPTARERRATSYARWQKSKAPEQDEKSLLSKIAPLKIQDSVIERLSSPARAQATKAPWQSLRKPNAAFLSLQQNGQLRS